MYYEYHVSCWHVSHLASQIRCAVVRYARKEAFLHERSRTEYPGSLGDAFQERLARERPTAAVLVIVSRN